jgi:short-subunit dehydrogenase
VVAADEPEIHTAAQAFTALGAATEAVQADLATLEGVEKLSAAIGGRPVDALLANAGRGLGKGFLDQDFDAVMRVVNTNITGTLALIQKIGRNMRSRGKGRILITGSIAGFVPGTLSGRLRRHESISRFLLLFAARGTKRHRSHGYTVPASGVGRGRIARQQEVK